MLESKQWDDYTEEELYEKPKEMMVGYRYSQKKF